MVPSSKSPYPSYSLELETLNRPAATRPPNIGAAQYIHNDFNTVTLYCCCMNPIRVIPVPTAGLNTPPEMFPTVKAPVATVRPIARPKNELLAWDLVVVTLRTTDTRRNVHRVSIRNA
eukprot:TRINITY_DN4228_c0_g1_i1.p1 TRINITY_DN4228_c0_g1~~TRINITY_DN4228_c0_g1_i1.p1  ORF type:complete len:118 (-),score=14.87 TRINITY_DN4228_c0_g1_i1:338-691(-)